MHRVTKIQTGCIQGVGRAGRAGRDAQPSKAIVLTRKGPNQHTDKDMKEYCTNNTSCPRSILLSDYDECTDSLGHSFKCCDICVHYCKHGDCDTNIQIMSHFLTISMIDLFLLSALKMLFVWHY